MTTYVPAALRRLVAEIIPLTAEGRVTAFLLQFNDPDRVAERQILIANGQEFGSARSL